MIIRGICEICGSSRELMMHRRQILRSMSGLAAAAAFGEARRSVQRTETSTDVTARLARYMVLSRDRQLPAAVAQAARHRILDTFGAIVSGARLKPGEMAIRYVKAVGGTAEASVPTTNIRTSAVNA